MYVSRAARALLFWNTSVAPITSSRYDFTGASYIPGNRYLFLRDNSLVFPLGEKIRDKNLSPLSF